jgi:hypothetical protein
MIVAMRDPLSLPSTNGTQFVVSRSISRNSGTSRRIASNCSGKLADRVNQLLVVTYSLPAETAERKKGKKVASPATISD